MFADLVEVISWVHDLYGLPPAPTEAKKMHGFCAAQDLDGHPSFSYCLPAGDAFSKILADINERISSP